MAKKASQNTDNFSSKLQFYNFQYFFRRRAGISSQPATASASAESDSPPSHWARIPDGEDYLRVKLDTISEEYKKTEKKFLETMEGRHNIFKIERVQNPELWTVYIQ